MKIEVDPSEVVEKKADDRGRVTLGAGLAEKKVTVAIVSVEDRNGGWVCANCGTLESLEEFIYAGGCPSGCFLGETGIPQKVIDAYDLDDITEEDETENISK